MQRSSMGVQTVLATVDVNNAHTRNVPHTRKQGTGSPEGYCEEHLRVTTGTSLYGIWDLGFGMRWVGLEQAHLGPGELLSVSHHCVWSRLLCVPRECEWTTSSY